jgi:hypothetical protein
MRRLIARILAKLAWRIDPKHGGHAAWCIPTDSCGIKPMITGPWASAASEAGLRRPAPGFGRGSSEAVPDYGQGVS